MIELFADCYEYMICGCESAYDDLHCATCTEVPARHTSSAVRSFLAIWADEEDRRLVAGRMWRGVGASERQAHDTIMNPLAPLLESFYVRETPRGVAFAGSSRFGLTLGRPVDSVLAFLSDAYGFTQLHFEEQRLSVYASYFGWGKLLIAQFRFQYEFPPPTRPWLAFVRLAAATQRILDNPDEFPDLPLAGVPVLKPGSPGPDWRLRSAQAPLEDDPW